MEEGAMISEGDSVEIVKDFNTESFRCTFEDGDVIILTIEDVQDIQSSTAATGLVNVAHCARERRNIDRNKRFGSDWMEQYKKALSCLG
jgi:hypothetical protein